MVKMGRNQTTTDMAEDRRHWHVMIQAGTLRSVEREGSRHEANLLIWQRCVTNDIAIPVTFSLDTVHFCTRSTVVKCSIMAKYCLDLITS